MNDKLAIPAPRRTGRLIMQWLLAFTMLAAGAAVYWWFMETAPKARPRPPERGRTLVDTTEAKFSRQAVMIGAYGTVSAARSVTVQPRVSGEVVEIGRDFVPGGILKEGALMLKVDAADYELAVPAAESRVAEARSALRTEEANQAIAKKDFELLNQKLSDDDRDLVLRIPQLAAARAAVAAAEAALEKARLDLSRTSLAAPFNAIVERRMAERGAQVTPQTQVAMLTGTDAFWVELAVPVSQLRWMEIPAEGGAGGSVVRIFDEAAWGPGVHREGRILRRLASVEEQGRLARVLVEIEDPLALKPENKGRPTMLTGSYVRAEIAGRELDAVFKVNRDHVHDGERLWIMGKDDALDIRTVEVAFRGRDALLVSGGVAAGERVVTSQISAPVRGMPLRTRHAQREAAAEPGRP